MFKVTGTLSYFQLVHTREFFSFFFFWGGGGGGEGGELPFCFCFSF